MSEPLTSGRTRRRSDAVKGESVVIEGILEMNSGIKLVTCYKAKGWSERSMRDGHRVCAYPNLTRSASKRS